jgi:hypothetical protein
MIIIYEIFSPFLVLQQRKPAYRSLFTQASFWADSSEIGRFETGMPGESARLRLLYEPFIFPVMKLHTYMCILVNGIKWGEN